MAESGHNNVAWEGQDRGQHNGSSDIHRSTQDAAHSRPLEEFTATTDVAPPQRDGQASATPTRGRGGTNATQTTEKQSASVEEARPFDMGANPAVSEETTLTGTGPSTRHTWASTEPFQNGYHFPPSYPWQQTTKDGLLAFWKFVTTPMGFFWTLYGLNVVAWGGMLFLLLCNASPAMCYPTCEDIDSPRRKWIEYDAQILTGLFCVTGFGLAPWRFRDLYHLLKFRVWKKPEGLRRLAGIHNSWFRLRGTAELPVDVGPGNIPEDLPRRFVPLPEESMPKPPLTGTRAPATAVWKLDFVIWTMVWNTFAQCGLCGIMWGMNRYDRPSWATGFLVAIACVIAMVGGLVMFLEGKKVKGIEGVPLTERDQEKLARDKELGVLHYNNIKDKKPKEKGGSEKAGDGS